MHTPSLRDRQLYAQQVPVLLAAGMNLWACSGRDPDGFIREQAILLIEKALSRMKTHGELKSG